MCERNMDQLALTHPQVGNWPTIQACALPEIERATFEFGGRTQCTEPHQTGRNLYGFINQCHPYKFN